MFKVPFSHLTFNLSSLVVVYNLPLGPPSNWTDPTAMALALMAQNNYTEPLPASPGRWLANPNRHKGATASLRLSLSPQAKAAILKSGSLFFEGRPHPVRTFTAAKTKPNQCRSCWQLGHSEAWCRRATPVCSSCSQDHPSHHHSTVAPNAPHHCVLCKGAHPSWTRWCVNRHIQLAAQLPLPKKARTKKPKAATSTAAPSGTGASSTLVSGSSVTDPTGNVRDPLTHGEVLFAPASPFGRDDNEGTINSQNGLNLINGSLKDLTPTCSIKGLRWTWRGNILLTPELPEQWDILAQHRPKILEHHMGKKFTLLTHGQDPGLCLSMSNPKMEKIRAKT
ncbi:hypothetical protein BOTBODRAFT_181947 [Botryobasidium botryosum FD-172 SS1]|uniref:Uncharacterized protein n=1 Tax=Botryobasidium botryosum (strain FD-172 SS1) TaxID=930990 RepID=A0A067LS29_BOTB1|nr:hypothetical protein BOTBODRAFT_181947 [Botryobasidium botryosum FD-172 SS1]